MSAETSTAVAIALTGGPACGEVILAPIAAITVLRRVAVPAGGVALHAYNRTDERTRKGAMVYLHERVVGYQGMPPGEGGLG